MLTAIGTTNTDLKYDKQKDYLAYTYNQKLYHYVSVQEYDYGTLIMFNELYVTAVVSSDRTDVEGAMTRMTYAFTLTS